MLGLVCPLLARLHPEMFVIAEPTSPPEPSEVSVDVSVLDTRRGGPEADLALRVADSGPWMGEAPRDLRALARRNSAPARLVIRARIVIGVLYDGRSIDLHTIFGFDRQFLALDCLRSLEFDEEADRFGS